MAGEVYHQREWFFFVVGDLDESDLGVNRFADSAVVAGVIDKGTSAAQPRLSQRAIGFGDGGGDPGREVIGPLRVDFSSM
jgi:hypothetical protein